MKSVRFFQSYPTREALASEVCSRPELYGKTSVSQFIKDNLPRESVFQAEILKSLRSWRESGLISRDALIWKQSAGVYGRNGLPDIMAVMDGRFVGLEVKRPYIGAATQLQEKTIRQIRDAGGLAEIVCFPDDAKAALIRWGLWTGDEKSEYNPNEKGRKKE